MTLLEHLGSNVIQISWKYGYFKANFAKSWYGGVSYLIFRENTKRVYIHTHPPPTQCLCSILSIYWDARLIWNWQVFLSVFFCTMQIVFVLWICEYLFIKRVNSLLFENLSCFLKFIRRILKGFDFFCSLFWEKRCV